MLLINKHPNIESMQLRSLLMFVLQEAGFETEHIMITVEKGHDLEDPVVLDYKQMSPRGEEVCCTEVFPSHEEIGEKYSCGISLHITVKINEEALVNYEVEAEHVRLQSEFPKPIHMEDWLDDFVYEMSRIVTLMKEGVVGQFIQRRHWWYRTQKYAMGRLTAWKKVTGVCTPPDWGVEDNGTVDLFEDVFKPKTKGDVWFTLVRDNRGRLCPRLFASREDAESAGINDSQCLPVEVWTKSAS